jgi:hypothetical protein
LKGLQAALEIPKLLSASSENEMKQLFTVQRLKFRGPDPPIYVAPTPPANPDGTQPPSEIDPLSTRDEEGLKDEEKVV